MLCVILIWLSVVFVFIVNAVRMLELVYFFGLDDHVSTCLHAVCSAWVFCAPRIPLRVLPVTLDLLCTWVHSRFSFVVVEALRVEKYPRFPPGPSDTGVKVDGDTLMW